jgi:hypothetical protein
VAAISQRKAAQPPAPTTEAPPAEAIRALLAAIQGLARHLGVGQHEKNACTVVHALGATLPDAQALHEYLKRQGG